MVAHNRGKPLLQLQSLPDVPQHASREGIATTPARLALPHTRRPAAAVARQEVAAVATVEALYGSVASAAPTAAHGVLRGEALERECLAGGGRGSHLLLRVALGLKATHDRLWPPPQVEEVAVGALGVAVAAEGLQTLLLLVDPAGGNE